MREKLRRFMEGRYGNDKLNMAILLAGLIFSVVALLIPFPLTTLVLHLAAYALMVIAIFRSLSRNVYRQSDT